MAIYLSYFYNFAYELKEEKFELIATSISEILSE